MALVCLGIHVFAPQKAFYMIKYMPMGKWYYVLTYGRCVKRSSEKGNRNRLNSATIEKVRT